MPPRDRVERFTGWVALIAVPTLVGYSVGNPWVGLLWAVLIVCVSSRFATYTLALGVLAVVIQSFLDASLYQAILLLAVICLAAVLLKSGPLLARGLRTTNGHLGPRPRSWVRRGLFLLGALCGLAVGFQRIPVFETLAWCVLYGTVAAKIPIPPAVSRSKRRGAVASGALAAAGVLLGVLVLEGGARLFLPDAVFGADTAELFEPDPDSLYSMRPGVVQESQFRPTPDSMASFSVSISEQGLRGPEVPPKQPEEIRIAMLGDSFTFCWGLPYEESFPALLEEHLHEACPSRPVTVLNAGVPAYGLWQERHFLTKRVLPLEPDIVVLQLFPTNDVSEALIEHKELLESYNRVHQQRMHDWYIRRQWPYRVEQVLEKVLRSYRAAKSVWPILDFTELVARTRLPQPADDWVWTPNADRSYYAEVFLREYYPLLEKSWKLMEEDARSIKQICEDNGIALYGFVIPNPDQFNESHWQRQYDLAAESVEYERFKDVRLGEALLERCSIPVIDIPRVIGEQPNPRELYYPQDRHFTARGSRVVSDALFRYLTSHVAELSCGEAGPQTVVQ